MKNIFLKLSLSSLMVTALCFLSSGISPAYPQTSDPFLVSATLYLSVDNWADVWLNGVHIVDQQPHTPPEKGFKTIKAKPTSLCYFKRDNLLALEVAKSVLIPVSPAQKSVGIAYILKMRLSDGREVVLTSADTLLHKSYYIADPMDADPSGWQGIYYNDLGWTNAFSAGPAVRDCAEVKDPESGELAPFLSARSSDAQSLQPGERHLFRRAFGLSIGPNPLCLTPTPVTPEEKPVVVKPETTGHLRKPRSPYPTPILIPTWTPSESFSTAIPEGPRHIIVPRTHPLIFMDTPTQLPVVSAPWVPATPALTEIPMESPQGLTEKRPRRDFAPMPEEGTPNVENPLPTPLPPIKNAPSLEASIKLVTSLAYHPTALSTPLLKPRLLKKIAPTPTINVQPTPTINWDYQPPTPTPTDIPVLPAIPTPTSTVETSGSEPQTLVVEVLPANLYVNFSDGPGIYRVFILDSQGKTIRKVYDRRVVAQSEDWAYWDGLDNSGQTEPSGTYRVLFTLNDKPLKDIYLKVGSPSP